MTSPRRVARDRREQYSLEELLAVVREIVGERGRLAYSGAFGLAEINPAGVSKAVALERWSTERRISAAEVWAFGDMPNDLPMIAEAGLGVAYRAKPVLADAADARLDHHGLDALLWAQGIPKSEWAAS